MDKEELHQILSSLWKNDDSVGKTYYNQALQDVQTAIDLQEEPESGNSLTKDEFLSEFLAKTLSRKLGIDRMPECEKEECNKAYTPDPYSPDETKYPYFEAYKEGYLAAISIAEDILVRMFNEYDDLTKD